MKTIYTIFILMLGSGCLVAQSCPEGMDAFQANDFDRAVRAFKACHEKDNKEPTVLFMLGYSLTSNQAYDEAIPYLKAAIQAKYKSVGNAYFQLARCYAAKGALQNAFTQLSQAADAGFPAVGRLDSSEFDVVRNSTEFISIQEKIKANAFPCLKNKENARFDFWVGEWEVYLKGKLIAKSTIRKAEGGCAILEDYQVLNGSYSGHSISYYNDREKRWNQYWVGSAGDKSEYYETENYEDALQFLTKGVDAKGDVAWTKMSYNQVDENTVVQKLMVSKDEGVTWNAGFSGTYKRKKYVK